MSTRTVSEEVAEDYKSSLEYLTNNDKYAINNLTVIARENLEHAEQISRALEDHIKKAPPHQKLPALYVLDSIVKNIGTPYSLFLGQNLYSTFMGAYSSVDQTIRRKMDEMLKTWKAPPLNSLDKRPVFPQEMTKNIDNALLRYKTAALQREQEHKMSQQAMLQRRAPGPVQAPHYRETPTPPQNGTFSPRLPYHQANMNMSLGYLNVPPQGWQQYPQPAPQPTPIHYGTPVQQPQAYAPPPQYHQPSLDHALLRDVAALIEVEKVRFAHNTGDQGVQNRLKALLDLQIILSREELPPPELQAVRAQVASLQAEQRASAPSNLPQSQPIRSVNPTPPPALPYQPPQAYSQVPAPTPTQLSTVDLASILAKVQRPIATSTPPQQPNLNPTTNLSTLLKAATAQTPTPPSQPPANDALKLLDDLRAAGLLSGSGAAASHSSTTHTPQPGTALKPLPANADLARLLAGVAAHHKPAPTKKHDVELTNTSVKIPRPHLILRLYQDRPNQCGNCGKRFLATPEGRTKKAHHLDWHFRTNQRLQDATRTGRSRSWYVDEMEWIKSRETGEGVEEDTSKSEEEQRKVAEKNDPKLKFVIAPNDSSQQKTCPICQDEFTLTRNEELQDFVWMNAIKIGDKIYHATCYEELKRDRENAVRSRTATPDSVLGKRKAAVVDISTNPSPAKRQEQAVA